MNFFSSSVGMLETIVVALGAGLQALGELKNREKCKAVTRGLVSRRLTRRCRMNGLYFRKNLTVYGGDNRPPPIE